jgi:predicted nucleic acid-binding protein
LSRKPKRAPKGIVDTSVVIAGAAAFRGAPLHPETDSGRLLLKWIEEGHFQWLYTEEILDEYKALLTRFRVRGAVIGTFINLLREEGAQVHIRKSRTISPDPGDDPFCTCAEAAKADFVVTLNAGDFPQERLGAKVIRPGDQLPARTSKSLRVKKHRGARN